MNGDLSRRLLRQWESPPTWFLVFAVLAWAQARVMPLFPSPVLVRIGGGILIVAGIVLFASAVISFRRGRTTILPRETPRAMLTTGPYSLSRNPIYLADAMILAGWVAMNDLASLLLVPVFMAVITYRFIQGEEAGLKAGFGAEFDSYASRVRRWL